MSGFDIGLEVAQAQMQRLPATGRSLRLQLLDEAVEFRGLAYARLV